MKLSTAQKLSFLVLTPYIVGWSPADSSFDEYSVGVGTGQYAAADCSGNTHRNSFNDAGVKMTHKFEAPFRAGLIVSSFPHPGGSNIIPYPDLAFDSRYFSLGTTGLRVGDANDIYGEVSMLDQVPLSSGKGFARVGVGMKTSDNTHLWLGLNEFPYYGGLAGQVDFPLSTDHFLFINGRYGSTGGVSEYGFSVGTRIRIY
jgi:hypothetical protein